MLEIKKNGEILMTLPGSVKVEKELIAAMEVIDQETEGMEGITPRFNHNDCDKMIVMVFNHGDSQVFFTIEEVEG